MPCSDVFTKPDQRPIKQLRIDKDEIDEPSRDVQDGFCEVSSLKIRCAYCTRQERVLSFQTLRPGDHISVGGEHFMKNIKSTQKSFYKHHAIVTGIELLSHDSCNATLIHFYTTPYDSIIEIQRTTEHLTLSHHEIYKVKYCHPTHSPETIIKRAEVLLNLKSKEKYNLKKRNCEHFCHLCCISNTESFQVKTMLSSIRQIVTVAWNIVVKSVKAICKRLMVSLDDVLKVGIKAKALIGVLWGVIGTAIICYLVFCIYKHHKYNREMKHGLMCSRCCKKEKFDSWLKFALYSSTQLGGIGLISIIMSACSGVGVVVPCTILICILTIFVMHLVPKLKEKSCTPFRGTMVQVKSTQNLWIGDVVSFQDGLTMSDGIISKVQRRTEKKANVSIVHYSKARIFGRRCVEEKEFAFDLSRDKIMGHDYSCYDVHPPELVVSRARQRIGETKYGIFSNRSCHFCHWAKVKDVMEETSTVTPLEMRYERDVKIGEDISDCRKINVDHKRDRKHATKTLPKKWARIPEEIMAGEIIQFKYGTWKRWHYAIATEVFCTSEPSPIVSVTVVHYGQSNTLCEETFTFDLRFEDVWIHKYHPSFRYSRDEVIRRARQKVGVVNNRSPHLAQNIVEKDTDQVITNFSELKPGDVIVFFYWSLKHAAVLTKIDNQFSKANNTAYVTIIHYALDKLFSTRTVKEESIFMDLLKDRVYRKNYAGFVSYPPEQVIERARRRINEQRFNAFRNTSWHLVHWAKVIQTPAFVDIKRQDETTQEILKSVETKHVIIPKVGDKVETFHRLPVQCWQDLQPGIILEFRYYFIPHQGIITEVDVKRSEVKVIHYGTDTLFSKRTIMVETIRVNIKRDKLWMYICNPEQCDKPEMIVQRARDRLGEQEWRRENRSWDFCKSCVLKKKKECALGKGHPDTCICRHQTPR